MLASQRAATPPGRADENRQNLDDGQQANKGRTEHRVETITAPIASENTVASVTQADKVISVRRKLKRQLPQVEAANERQRLEGGQWLNENIQPKRIGNRPGARSPERNVSKIRRIRRNSPVAEKLRAEGLDKRTLQPTYEKGTFVQPKVTQLH